MSTSIGKMDKYITLQQPVGTPDGMGGSKTLFEPVGSVWAEFLAVTPQNNKVTGTITSEITRKMSIWQRDDVRMGWRVVWGDHTFKVLSAYPYDKNFTTLVCEEVIR